MMCGQKSWDWVAWALRWRSYSMPFYYIAEWGQGYCTQLNKEVGLANLGGSRLCRRAVFRL